MTPLTAGAGRWVGCVVVGAFLWVGLPVRAPAQDEPAGVVSEAQARSFGKDLERVAASGNIEAFNKLVDPEAILAAAMKDVQVSDEFREGFLKGARLGMVKPTSFNGAVVAQVKAGAKFNMLHTRLRGKHRTALFRLIIARGGGVGYTEFLLEEGPGNKVRAVDAYSFASGELISQTIRRGYVAAAADANQGIVSRLLGYEPEYLKGLPKLGEIGTLVHEGKPQEALEAYEKLPRSLQDDKSALLVKLSIAQKLDEATYSATIEHFRTLFPNDAATALLSIDGFTLLKEYDKALASVDVLDKLVGGDPYMNVLRTGILATAGQPEKALEAARATVAGLPNFIEGYWTLLGLSLRQKDHDLVLSTLKQIHRKFHVKFKDLSTVSQYAGFVKSPQYEEWKRYLAEDEAKTKPAARKAGP